jgi:hypothetical protein
MKNPMIAPEITTMGTRKIRKRFARVGVGRRRLERPQEVHVAFLPS